MTRLGLFFAALASALVLGCSSEDSSGSAAASIGDGGGGTGGNVDPGPYPEGPYGRDVGSTVANMQWQGYVNETAEGLATQRPFVDYSMDAVRRSGKRYAFVHVSEFI